MKNNARTFGARAKEDVLNGSDANFLEGLFSYELS